MSTNSRRGYLGEVGALGLCRLIAPNVYRPRTTSYAGVDTGDIHGLPLVVSVKNHSRNNLSAWVDELAAMVTRSPWETGIVIHKRQGRALARDWYVTTQGSLMLPFLAAYVATQSVAETSIDLSGGITSPVHDRSVHESE